MFTSKPQINIQLQPFILTNKALCIFHSLSYSPAVYNIYWTE